MEPLNLFLLSRNCESQLFNDLHKHLSHVKTSIHQDDHEILSLREFVDVVISLGLTIDELDGFYYSYRIPQIGKEFDLLKIDEERCLNIELKSQMIDLEKIKNQLIKNTHYLKSTEKTLMLFTYVSSNNKCFTLDENENLIECSIDSLVSLIKTFSDCYLNDIDLLFRVKDFLVSPVNTPKLFIDGYYFLTSQQQEIKNKIIERIESPNGNNFISLTGSPGTGKTLLVYDIAKTMALKGLNVLVVHCGIKSDGHRFINEYYNKLDIVVPKQINDDFNFSDYNAIFVDESQRIYDYQYNLICNVALRGNIFCVFSFDKHQILSQAEKRRKIWERIDAIDNIEKHRLSERIRTNMEMAAFIRKVRNLNTSEVFNSKNIEVVYANNVDECKNILKYFENHQYTFINFSKSNYQYSPFSEYDSDLDTHHVVGQEFDNVVMVLDRSFFYSEHGVLSAYSHPNPDYLYTQLFYQGVTRVREKLALIVVENEELYRKIISVF